jgi:hypothetical protein
MKTIRNTHAIIYLIAILIAATLAGPKVHAQDAGKFYLSINAGPALALGQLDSQHFKSGGYALSGFSTVAEGVWYFLPSLGAGVAVSQTKFPFADGAYSHDLVNSDPFMETLFLKSGPYQVRSLTAGLYYRRHITGKFSASGKLTGGLLWAQTPDQLYVASYYTVPNHGYKITPSKSRNATFQPGLDIHYQLVDHVCLSLKADYNVAVSAFNFQTSTDSYVKRLTFSYLNTMIGIDFRF